MKANSGFVMAMIALCAVASVDDISAEKINADHVRLMYSCLTPEACELFGDLSGNADRTYLESVVMVNEPQFLNSGLRSATAQERVLIELIFRSQGRKICFGEMRLVVSPSSTKIAEKRRIDFREKSKMADAHLVEELKTQPA